MFHGQIKQLFPGQMAEVQIGGQKMMAKLEVPMKAGDAYYFQVKSVTPELQVKVVSGPLQASEGHSRQLSNLIDSMQLPKSPEMQIVLNHFLKQQLPVSKEVLLDAVKLLKTVQPTLHNEALNSIQKLVELKIPLNVANFTALFGVETKEGLHNLLSSLRNALIMDPSLQIQQKESILASMEEVGRMTASAAEKALFSGAMLKLFDENAPREERFQLLQLLKNSGVMPSNITLANLHSVLHSELVESEVGKIRQVDSTMHTGSLDLESRPVSQLQSTSNTLMELWKSLLGDDRTGTSNGVDERLNLLKVLVKNDTVLQQTSKSQLIGLLEELEGNSLAEIRTSPVGEQVSKMMIRMMMEQIQSMPFRKEQTMGLPRKLNLENMNAKLSELVRAMEHSQLPISKELIQGAHATVEQAVNGKVIKDMMQSLFKSFGFNYEAELQNRNPDFVKTLEMLKPQLITLLHDSSISHVLREAAEAAVTRLNGSLLQSGESGMNQQIVMQLPLELLGKRIDATLQWSGRKRTDGKIDADFARILFYLDLESMGKTIVDMQVQNRVVSVTVFNNDDELKHIGSLLQGKLKAGLESLEYRLSGITFKSYEKEEIKESVRRNEMMVDRSGVDFRI